MAFDSDDEDIAGRLDELISELRGSRGLRSTSSRAKKDCLAAPHTDSETGEPLRDLTKSAVWSVSTAKAGNGAEQLLDGCADTYWQSDGVQPHTITAQFSSKRRVKQILLYLNFQVDESYTPAVVTVRAGSNFHDLRVIRPAIELDSPEGWVAIQLAADASDLAPDGDDDTSEDAASAEEDEGTSAADADTAQPALRRQAREERVRARARRQEKRNAERAQRRHRRRELARLQEDRSYVNAHMVQVMIHCNHQSGRDSHVRMVKVLGSPKQVARVGPKFTTREFQMYEVIR